MKKPISTILFLTLSFALAAQPVDRKEVLESM